MDAGVSAHARLDSADPQNPRRIKGKGHKDIFLSSSFFLYERFE
jgi:hypothetical protein